MTYLSTLDYTSRNIRSRLTQQTVKDASGAIKSQKTINYDNTTIGTASGAVQHDYTNYPTTMTFRGNPTEVKVWRNTDGVWLTTTNWYNELGNLTQTQDPLGHQTTYGYTDSWENSACAPVGGTAQAFLTSVTNPLGHVTTTKYYSCTSQVGRTIDANNQATTFTYDSLRRPDVETRPDGGTTNYDYDDVARKVTKTQTIDASTSVTTESYYDGLANLTQTRLTTDPEGTVFTDTAYDALGRQYKVWNPYRSTSDPTYGFTEIRYDGLGRAIKVIPSDGTATANNTTTAYSGNCGTVTDQAGKKRKTCTDAVGHVVQVWEPDAAGSFIYETAYQYDVLDNLTRIDQKGNDPNSANWRTRTFTYNSLSLKTAESTPEGGSTTYTYDNDGLLLTQADARSITITYGYDALHRTTTKDFSNTTPNPDVNYYYDQTSYNSLTITNGKGRRTGMKETNTAPEPTGFDAWSYDSMGRVLADRRTTNGVTQQFNYTFNYDDSMKSVTYPSGRRVDYAYSGAGKALSAIDSANSINYVTQATYAPQGAPASAKNGVTGSFAGLTRTHTYNKRLQPNLISATTPTATFLSLTYNYNLNTADNGSVMSVTNNLVGGRTQSFTYDELNRVKTAQSQATSGADCWGLSYGYDIWSNLLSATVTKCSAPALSLAVNNSNKVTNTGFTYDAVGNMTADGVYTYTYDAENRMTLADGVNYFQDGDGRRVKKDENGGSTYDKLYWYGPGGEALQETNLSGGLLDEYVFFSGQRIARRTSSGTVYYFFSDHLGSARVLTNATGGIAEESDFYPFGGERVITDTLNNQYKFTGHERDAEVGLDHTWYRQYASNLGRWTSADPYKAYCTNPQGLNRYQYVTNKPTTLIDPTGQYHWDFGPCNNPWFRSLPWWVCGNYDPYDIAAARALAVLERWACSQRRRECIRNATDQFINCLNLSAEVSVSLLVGCGFACGLVGLDPEVYSQCLIGCLIGAGVTVTGIASVCAAGAAIQVLGCWADYLACRIWEPSR